MKEILNSHVNFPFSVKKLKMLNSASFNKNANVELIYYANNKLPVSKNL